MLLMVLLLDWEHRWSEWDFQEQLSVAFCSFLGPNRREEMLHKSTQQNVIEEVLHHFSKHKLILGIYDHIFIEVVLNQLHFIADEESVSDTDTRNTTKRSHMFNSQLFKEKE